MFLKRSCWVMMPTKKPWVLWNDWFVLGITFWNISLKWLIWVWNDSAHGFGVIIPSWEWREQQLKFSELEATWPLEFHPSLSYLFASASFANSQFCHYFSFQTCIHTTLDRFGNQRSHSTKFQTLQQLHSTFLPAGTPMVNGSFVSTSLFPRRMTLSSSDTELTSPYWIWVGVYMRCIPVLQCRLIMDSLSWGSWCKTAHCEIKLHQCPLINT